MCGELNLLRFVPTIVGLIAFALLTILYLYSTNLYLSILDFIGIKPTSYPFIDGEFMYAMKQCWAQGVDVYQSVPCDVVPSHKMAYSPLWQRLPFLPADKAARVPVGLATDLLLLMSIAILPPARTVRDAVLLSLATISTMVCFALERNNIDVWIYLLVVGGALLFIRPGVTRGVAYFVFMMAGLLKYYPMVLFGLALKERPTRFLLVAALSAAGLALFATVFWSELLEELPNIPTDSPYFDLVGIVNIPLAIAQVAATNPSLGPRAPALIALSSRLLLTAVVVGWAIISARRPGFNQAIARLTEADSILLVAGCLVMGGCYLLGQNVGYRGIFLLIVLSGLLALCRATDDRELRSRLETVALLIVPMMWMEGIRNWTTLIFDSLSDSPAVRFYARSLAWELRELLWLNLERMMLAVLIAYVVRSATGSWVRSLVRRLVLRRRLAAN
jgi:hypothetical protein